MDPEIDEVKKVEQQIKKVEQQIEKVEQQIVDVEKELAEATDKEEVAYLRRKEEQLRRKEEQLRREKEQLRREKELLLLRQAPSSAPPRPLAPGHLQKFAEEMREFATSWLDLEKKPAEDLFIIRKTVEMPSGFLGERTQPAIWVHPAYQDIFQAITKEYEEWITPCDVGECGNVAVKKKNVHLLGTSGTGKSYFGYLWLLYQAILKRKVLFRTKSGETWLVFDFSGGKAEVFVTNQQDVIYMGAPEIWLIVDGRSGPVDYSGPILQTVSAKKEGFHEFAKDGYKLYMEAWSYADCQDCLEALGVTPKVPLDVSFHYVGGMIRRIMDARSFEHLKSDIVGGMTIVKNWENILNYNAVSDYVMHYAYRPQNLDLNAASKSRVWEHMFKFASVFVRKHIMQKVLKGQKEKKRKFWRLTELSPTMAGIRGSVFEVDAHDILRSGGIFRTKLLGTWIPGENGVRSQSHAVVDWDMNRPVAVYYSDRCLYSCDGEYEHRDSNRVGTLVSTLQINQYVEPLSKRQKSWDSFLPLLNEGTLECWIFQMAATLHHNTIWTGIDDLIVELDAWAARNPYSTPIYKFVFVTTPDKFSNFALQKWLIPKEKRVYKQAQKNMDRVTQMVLEVRNEVLMALENEGEK